jgi:hypothetical protein
MFERFTEKARRVIFFARYEASHYGAPYIETEHLLLGLLREEKSVHLWVPKAQPEIIRQRVDAASEKRPSTPTNVDLPLSNEAKRALKYAADESERLADKHIGTEHLLLGLLDEEDCFAAKLLRECEADPAKLRMKFAERIRQQWVPFHKESIHGRGYRSTSQETVEIHGDRWNADYVRDAVSLCRTYNWHWHQSSWKPRDIVINRKSGSLSFDLTLAQDKDGFALVKEGWKKDHCFICRWELLEAQDDHGSGYTNGHDWLCNECHEKFWRRPDFFASSFSEIT